MITQGLSDTETTKQPQLPATTKPPVVTTSTSTSHQATLLQLPANIEVDTAMMEHLARAAVELHAARSGKLLPSFVPHEHPTLPLSSSLEAPLELPKTDSSYLSPLRHRKSIMTSSSQSHVSSSSPYRNPYYGRSPRAIVGTAHPSNNPNHHQHTAMAVAGNATTKFSILQSPDVRTFLESTANQQGVTNAATETGIAQSIIITNRNDPNSNNDNDYIQRHHSKQGTISQTTLTTTGTTATTSNAKVSGAVDGNDSSTEARNQQQLQAQSHNVNDTTTYNESEMTSPIRTTTTTSSGTGSHRKKPVTAAINTVPYANCNARLLLQGAAPILPPRSTPTSKSTDHSNHETSRHNP
jgi:hypothetical protein